MRSGGRYGAKSQRFKAHDVDKLMRARIFSRRFRDSWRRYCREQRGAAAVEFAMVLTLLTVPVLNVVDLAFYAWDRMQLDNAAQVGAQAAWATCFTPASL